MQFSYVTHRLKNTSTAFTYRSQLQIIQKKNLMQIAAFLGLSFGSSATKDAMIDVLDTYVKKNPADVLDKLCVKELDIVKAFTKAGANTPIIKAPRRTHDNLKMLLLVSVCYDKNTKKENLLMPDELRELFAPDIDKILKQKRKEEKMEVKNPPSVQSSKIFESVPESQEKESLWGMIPGRMTKDEFLDFIDNTPVRLIEADDEINDIWDDWGEEDDGFDDNDDDDEIEELPLGTASLYVCSIDLINDVRDLTYESQVKVFKVFNRFIREEHETGLFASRFRMTYRNILYDGDKLDLDTLEWVHYTMNDFDNAVTEIDYYNPMKFFALTRKLELLIKKLKEIEKKDK